MTTGVLKWKERADGRAGPVGGGTVIRVTVTLNSELGGGGLLLPVRETKEADQEREGRSLAIQVKQSPPPI